MLFFIVKPRIINKEAFMKSEKIKYIFLGLAFGIVGSSIASTQPSLFDIDKFSTLLAEKQSDIANRHLDSIPDILKCDRMSWFENCDELNRHTKRNPQGHLRAKDINGIEHNFPPGTPSVVINAMVSQDDKSMKEFILHLDQKNAGFKLLTSNFTRTVSEMGGMKSVRTLDQMRLDESKPKNIDPSKLRINAFIHSECSACFILMENLVTFKEKYPQININVFLTDNAPEYLKNEVIGKGFKGKILTQVQTEKVKQRGFLGWPVTWVENPSAGVRDVMLGVKTMGIIENRSYQVSLNKSEKSAQTEVR